MARMWYLQDGGNEPEQEENNEGFFGTIGNRIDNGINNARNAVSNTYNNARNAVSNTAEKIGDITVRDIVTAPINITQALRNRLGNNGTEYEPSYSEWEKATNGEHDIDRTAYQEGGNVYSDGVRKVMHNKDEIKRVIRQANMIMNKAVSNGEFDGERAGYMSPKFIWRKKLNELLSNYPELAEWYGIVK